MSASLHNTELTDRTLWYDGDSSYDASRLVELIGKYRVEYVNQITPEVTQYNKHVQTVDEIRTKTRSNPLDKSWNIPPKYANLDVREYVIDKLVERTRELSDTEVADRALRVLTELSIYEKRNLFDVLRTIIYVINTLTESNTVWGVGRGSSVSSYVLYLIGVHDVDSYEYRLNIEDFLHD